MNNRTTVASIGEYVKLTTAAEIRRVKYHTLYQFVRRNEIPTVMLGRELLIKISDLQRYSPRY